MKKRIVIISVIIALSAVIITAGLYACLVIAQKEIVDNGYICVEQEKDNFVLKPYESYDMIVSSGDVGDITYKYTEGTWELP
ncbi:MAG: hypothetical protein IJZ90_01485 [Clostridia bacterium]|nr:hypothetical protein [Clostridia bacterium]